MGILDLVTSGSKNGEFFSGLAAHVGLVYFSLTIGLNIIATCLICGRILFYAKRMQDLLHCSSDHYRVRAAVHVIWDRISGVIWPSE
jgi:hypothetical protein